MKNLDIKHMNEPYLSFGTYCKQTYGRKLYRIALDAGMSCPNRDGTIGTGGCIFCDAGGSGDFAVPYHGQKMSRGDFSWFHQSGVSDGDFIAYFQAYTNTYAPLPVLKQLFSSALSDPLFAGISVATRPDCLGDDVLALFDELKQQFPDKFIWIELGLQSMHDASARLIRRGYDLPVFLDCTRRLHEHEIPFLVHVILGLPGETKEMIYETVSCINAVHPLGVKLQLLHVLRHTELDRMYQNGEFRTLDFDEYIDIVAGCIARLAPGIVIHRLTGDGNRDILTAPLWSCDKRRVLNAIHHELKVRNITQGCLANICSLCYNANVSDS